MKFDYLIGGTEQVLDFSTVPKHLQAQAKDKVALLSLVDPGTLIEHVGYRLWDKYSYFSDKPIYFRVEIEDND